MKSYGPPAEFFLQTREGDFTSGERTPAPPHPLWDRDPPRGRMCREEPDPGSRLRFGVRVPLPALQGSQGRVLRPDAQAQRAIKGLRGSA